MSDKQKKAADATSQPFPFQVVPHHVISKNCDVARVGFPGAGRISLLGAHFSLQGAVPASQPPDANYCSDGWSTSWTKLVNLTIRSWLQNSSPLQRNPQPFASTNTRTTQSQAIFHTEKALANWLISILHLDVPTAGHQPGAYSYARLWTGVLFVLLYFWTLSMSAKLQFFTPQSVLVK